MICCDTGSCLWIAITRAWSPHLRLLLCSDYHRCSADLSMILTGAELLCVSQKGNLASRHCVCHSCDYPFHSATIANHVQVPFLVRKSLYKAYPWDAKFRISSPDPQIWSGGERLQRLRIVNDFTKPHFLRSFYYAFIGLLGMLICCVANVSGWVSRDFFNLCERSMLCLLPTILVFFSHFPYECSSLIFGRVPQSRRIV